MYELPLFYLYIYQVVLVGRGGAHICNSVCVCDLVLYSFMHVCAVCTRAKLLAWLSANANQTRVRESSTSRQQGKYFVFAWHAVAASGLLLLEATDQRKGAFVVCIDYK